MKNLKMKRAVLYTRLSKEKLMREGNDQYEILSHYAHDHDIKIIHHYCDTGLKTKLGRKFVDMIEDIKEFDGIDIVLINSVETISQDYDSIIEVAKVLNDMYVHIVVVDSLNEKVKDIKNMNELLREANRILTKR
jgi:DNA invertase Pin-like site-specific DNA recombinase